MNEEKNYEEPMEENIDEITIEMEVEQEEPKAEKIKANIVNPTKEFIKTHKREIGIGVGALIFVGGVAYVAYSKGRARGIHDNTYVNGGRSDFNYGLMEDGENYSFAIRGATYGNGIWTHWLHMPKKDAIKVAKDVLEELGCLKTLAELPKEV